MNPQGFAAWDVLGALVLVGLIGCAVGLALSLAGWVLGKIASWSGGLLDRPKRRRLK